MLHTTGLNVAGILTKENSKQLFIWMVPDHNIGQALLSYILLDNDSFITRPSVIGVPSNELESGHMKEEAKIFVKLVETKIENESQPMYEAIHPEAINYT